MFLCGAVLGYLVGVVTMGAVCRAARDAELAHIEELLRRGARFRLSPPLTERPARLHA